MSETARYRARRDESTADDAFSDRSLQCAARGCPNRWTVDMNGSRACSAHAWAQPHQWPAVTQQQLDAEADRAYHAQRAQHQPAPEPMSADEKRAALMRLRDLFAYPNEPRAWARRLRDQEEAGEILSLAQRDCWRVALRVVDIAGAA